MKFDFNFRTVDSEKEVEKVVEFIRQYPLAYSNYMEWTEKVKSQLLSGEKEAIFALSEEKVVADLIFQGLDSGDVEIKNLRTYDMLQKRGFGHFMLSQLEVEAANSFNGVFVDMKKDNVEVRSLFESRGYQKVEEKCLYDTGLDVIYYKEFLKTKLY